VTEAHGELWDVIWKLYLGYEEIFKVKEEEEKVPNKR